MPTRVGLIELPALKLLDGQGLNWTALRQSEPLASKQILLAQLLHEGFDASLVDLKDAVSEWKFGETTWRGRRLTKVAVGRSWTELDPREFEVWGVTINYLQEREIACEAISYLARGGGRVVVGGSDAFAEPEPYLRAGADVVIRDKSGAANVAAIRWLAGGGSADDLTGVALADGTARPARRPPMSPQEWPVPDVSVVQQTLGTEYWEAPLPESLKPIGVSMLDLGCDRHCDFCETPTYRLGYKAMTPERADEWLTAQRDAGARSVIILSDQFLGRVLWPDGREKILQIMAAARRLGIAVLWGNGIEINKATLGRGKRDSDKTPDEELVSALWGWDGQTGCAQVYVPAERPSAGPTSYEKLMPWRQHVTMMEAITKAGVPDINYGVIVGLPEDSDQELKRTLELVHEVRDRLLGINPKLRFRVMPFALRPLPGTPQSEQLKRHKLLRFDDSAILGGFWTACADTRHLSYEQVSDWQTRFIEEINGADSVKKDWQGVTALY
ncbi:radical SAM protein [Streptomyces hygroscopicus]|uniref:radical SAM protein n=1 Tax=Streptomyces hygroscopicus TaxID=1912 RepID=UPI003685FB31